MDLRLLNLKIGLEIIGGMLSLPFTLLPCTKLVPEFAQFEMYATKTKDSKDLYSKIMMNKNWSVGNIG